MRYNEYARGWECPEEYNHPGNSEDGEAENTRDEILHASAQTECFAELLRVVQKIRKITYLDLSERTGLHRNTISYIFSGERINSARLNDLAKIAHAMDCDLRIELIPLKNVTYQKSGA
jgi:DNA-binding Xre family transcriptional regulator